MRVSVEKLDILGWAKSEHINSSNQKNHYYDQMGKRIVNLSNNKYKNNNNSTCHINHIQKSLLMSTVDTPEKDASNFDRKLDKIKMRASLINSSSSLFSCSIHVVYNIVYRVQNQRLMLKLFIPTTNRSIFPKKIIKYIF